MAAVQRWLGGVPSCGVSGSESLIPLSDLVDAEALQGSTQSASSSHTDRPEKIWLNG
eukprot:CAMPEP_0194296720 /NCGR_PEP_ID=MMETSP0169-20130528/56944_1 /TAXON_ID=218684 /ORGANISM="Corethron pennatum, Strain L29A3" /LENGTH=56 /DNA_ID=CAMNT_0039046283 /DNA_START=216 /DNA_END=383 /DNA_ORIENTATION=+